MAIPVYNKPNASRDHNVNGNEAYAVWLPCGTNPYTDATFCGIDSTSSVPKGGGALCTTVSLENLKLASLYESEIRGIGKNPVKFVSGAKIDDFKLGMLGGDVRTLKILYGLNPSSSGINGFKPLPDTGKPTGHLIIRKWQPSLGIVATFWIPDMCIKFTDVASGAEVDTDAMQEVTFYKPQNGDHYIFEGNTTVSWGFWKDHAINSNAPDGTIADYVIGTGNVAGGGGAVSPIPLLINDDVIGSGSSNYKRHFLGVWVNGVLQSDAQVTYTTGTRTLTFTSGNVPANGAAVLVAYVSTWTAALNTENFAEADTSITAENYPWYKYA